MKVLVAGAHGTAGHSIAKSFQEQPDAQVTTASRRREGPAGCRHLPLDLLDEAAVGAAAALLAGTEVLVFAARAPGADAQHEADVNVAMLRNLVAAVDRPGTSLRRVCLIHGTKWYGCHLGPYPIPAREADARCRGPLFYFGQYDWLAARRRDKRWDMVTLRPHTVWGFSEGTKNNLITLVAAYAAIQRERGLPLHFPGPLATYRKRSQATAADLLGRAAVWACISAQAGDRDFNITDGDTFSWESLWPRIAASFGMPAGEPGHGSFASAFVGAQQVWQQLQQRHDLRHADVTEIASPAYGDGLLACTWDDVSSMEAIRAAGWTASVDSESVFLDILGELRRARVIPCQRLASEIPVHHDGATDVPRLLSPLTLRGTTLRNRIVVSPMCQYQAVDGLATDWHLVHLGRFAMGGAGMVLTEAVAVEPRGRITHGDLGLWSGEHAAALARIARFLSANGAVPAVQLAHAGRKASMQRPWFGNGPLNEADAARGDRPWPVVAPSATPVAPGWLIPAELARDELATLRATWVNAARLAVDAGFAAIEVHCAHGYLLHQFLSPLSNRRVDEYGGVRAARMRFPLEVVDAVRGAIPSDMPLLVRVSAVDGIEGGWELPDTVAFAAELRERGVDVIDCSSGGMLGSATGSPLSRRPGYQVPFSSAVRQACGIKTMAVGLILDAQQAEQVIAQGAADLVAIGREFLANPNWGSKAATDLLGQDGYRHWPQNAGWWLSRREIESDR